MPRRGGVGDAYAREPVPRAPKGGTAAARGRCWGPITEEALLLFKIFRPGSFRPHHRSLAGKGLTLGPLGSASFVGRMLCPVWRGCVVLFPTTGPTAGPLRAEGFHWGLREARLSSVASRSPPSRRALVQRTGPTKYPKPKPSAAGSVWKGGARERSEKSPSGGYERSGLCDDARQRRGKEHSPDLTRRQTAGEPRRRQRKVLETLVSKRRFGDFAAVGKVTRPRGRNPLY